MSPELFIIGCGILLNLVVIYRCRDIIEWTRWQSWLIVAILCVVPYLISGFVALCWVGWKIGKAIIVNRMERW